MSEVISSILMVVIGVAVPVLTKAAVSAIQKFTDSLEQQTSNALASRFLSEISDAVSTAVTATSQTYVDSLKAAGTFDTEAQQTALQMALSTCLSSLSDSAKTFIQDSYGDVTDYLTAKIEAAVSNSKY